MTPVRMTLSNSNVKKEGVFLLIIISSDLFSSKGHVNPHFYGNQQNCTKRKVRRHNKQKHTIKT